ncbi:MAG: Ger(x)C family spore germination protein [Betaproteobacteria bacterium]
MTRVTPLFQQGGTQACPPRSSRGQRTKPLAAPASGIFLAARIGSAVVICGAICGLVAGCWDRREINQLAMVSVGAVDIIPPDEGSAAANSESGTGRPRFRVTAEFYRPRGAAQTGGEGGGDIRSRRVSVGVGTGWTIAGAVEELDVKMPRHPYWTHQTASIIGADLARHGMLELLDLWDRDPEIRRSTLVLLSRGPAAEIVTRAQSVLERSLAEEILGISRVVPRSGYGFLPTVHSILLDITGDTACTVIPFISLGPVPEPAQPGPVPEGQEPKAWTPAVVPTARLTGAGVLYRDKLVGELSPRETRGVMWTRNKVPGAVVEVECPGSRRPVALKVTRSSAQVGIRVKDGALEGSVKVQLEGNVAEQGGEVDLSTERALASLESRLAEAVRNEISEALAKTKSYGTDLAGFGPALHRAKPGLWRSMKARWPEEYRNLPVTIEVKARLRRTGLTLKPPKIH